MKSAIVLKKKLIANPSTIKKFLKTIIKSYGYEARGFRLEMPKVSCIYVSIMVILIDSVLQKTRKLLSTSGRM